MHFSSLWFWALGRELGSKLTGGRVKGGRAFTAGLILTIERDSAWDVIFWLDSRFPRIECLPSRGPHTFPPRFNVLSKAHVQEVVCPQSDRRIRMRFESAKGLYTLEYYGFSQPALQLLDSEGKPVAVAGATKPKAEHPGKPFLLDVLNTGFRDDPGTLRGLDELWLKAALQSGASPWKFIEDAGNKLVQNPVTGYLVSSGGQPEGVSLLDFSAQLPELTFEDCGSPSFASSRFVSTARRESDLKDVRSQTLGVANDMKTRLTKTMHELRRDRKLQNRHPELQRQADWLTSQLSTIKKGQTEITVPGEDGDQTVELDPKLKPSDQAERWYQAARRMKRGMEVTQARLDQTTDKLDRLVRLLSLVEGRTDSVEPDVTAAFADLEALVSKSRTRTEVQVKQRPLRFRRFRSPGGLAIWVGRNNKENDELTLHFAHKEDLWFHAQQTPGSHVVLRSHALGQPPAKTDILAAAAAAAYYSKARTSTKVPVIYTLAKYVRKPRQAAAGAVKVEREKSVMVQPAVPPVWDKDE